jgi:hypothetical protein
MKKFKTIQQAVDQFKKSGFLARDALNISDSHRAYNTLMSRIAELEAELAKTRKDNIKFRIAYDDLKANSVPFEVLREVFKAQLDCGDVMCVNIFLSTCTKQTCPLIPKETPDES